MKLKDDEYLSRSGNVKVNSDMYLDASATAVDNNKNLKGNEDDSEDDDSSRANASAAAATRSFRGMDWEDEKEEEQLFCAKFVVDPKVLRLCLLLGMLSGLLTGWEIGTNFGDDYDFYFQFRCPAKDDELRYELYPDCEPMPIEKQENLELMKIVVEVVAQVLAAMIVSPIISDGWGRKRTFIVGAVTNCIGAIVQACSVNIQMLIAFRTFSTFGLGLLNTVGPMYLSEVSPIHRRGRYTTLWFFGASLGFVIASLFNVLLREITYGWRAAYTGDIVFCLFIVALAVWSRVPESHHYYILQRRYDDALRTLTSIRVEESDGLVEGNEENDRERQQQNAVDVAIVQWEYRGLIQERNETIGKNTLHTFWNKYRNLFLGGRAPPPPSPESLKKGKKMKKKKHKYSPRMPQRLLYGCLLQIFNQFSGIRAVSWYLTFLLSAVYGVDKTENWNIAIYCFNCIAATLCYVSVP